MPYDDENPIQEIFIPAPAGIQLATYDLELGYDLAPLVGWLLGSRGTPITRDELGYVTVLSGKDVVTKAIDPGVDFDADAWVKEADAELQKRVSWRKSEITRMLDQRGRVRDPENSSVWWSAAAELIQEGTAKWDESLNNLIAVRKPAAA